MNKPRLKHLLCFCLFLFCSRCITFASPPLSDTHAESDTLYYLIAGSYSSLSSAKVASKQYLDQGLTPEILFPRSNQRVYRLSISQAAERPQLEKTASALEELFPKLNTWILMTAEESTARSISAPLDASKAASEQFFLIISSYLDYDAAYRQASDLAEQGYEPMILLPSTSEERFRVSVYRTLYKPEIEAYSAMLKRQRRYPGWILSTDAQQEVLAYSTALNAELQQEQLAQYHLIAASFTERQSAEDFMRKVQAQGLEPYLIEPSPQGASSAKRLFRVSLSQSDDRKVLEAYAQSLRKDPVRMTLLNGGLWILSK